MRDLQVGSDVFFTVNSSSKRWVTSGSTFIPEKLALKTDHLFSIALELTRAVLEAHALTIEALLTFVFR